MFDKFESKSGVKAICESLGFASSSELPTSTSLASVWSAQCCAKNTKGKTTMKKIMTAFAAVALCGAVSADVTSANTVGYVTSTVPKAGNKTFAVTLTDCANPGAAVRVDKLLTSEGFYANGNFDLADQIWRWDTKVNKWAKYFYEQKGNPRTGVTKAWKKWNYAEEKVEDITEYDVVEPGETFIFTRNGDDPISLTLSGQVKEFTATPSYSIPKAGNVFMAYAWPVEIKIADITNLATFSPEAYANGNFDLADQIWRWDATINKWAKYFYEQKGNPRTGVTKAWKKWNYAEEKVEDLTDADKLAPGEGFIYTRNGDETLTLTWKALQSAE